jgi:hypothetical protein
MLGLQNQCLTHNQKKLCKLQNKKILKKCKSWTFPSPYTKNESSSCWMEHNVKWSLTQKKKNKGWMEKKKD